jgi:stage V sporulation protein AD
MSLCPSIISCACTGGKKEGEGPMANYFDQLVVDPYFGQKTFEQGESRMVKETVQLALQKAKLKQTDINFMFAGDLLNQCIGTTYGIRELGIPFLGIYGACSTMAEGLSLSSLLADNNIGRYILAATSSHFCTAERQFRLPLEYGGQRTPTAQWTATASGAVILSPTGAAPFVRAVSIGTIVDMGITDANNMGAAMAPAAASTIKQFLDDTRLLPENFDFIVTGDLGKVGSRLLCELLEQDNINIRSNHKDCGMMMYSFDTQDVHAGGSGCGCSASILCGYFLEKIKMRAINNILFCATGALMSPTSSQQGESIPGICHAVWISNTKN